MSVERNPQQAQGATHHMCLHLLNVKVFRIAIIPYSNQRQQAQCKNLPKITITFWFDIIICLAHLVLLSTFE